jgi:hypothetical protein
MTFEMQEILRSKRAFRERLTALPIGEKLRMLEALRDRCLEVASVRARLRVQKAAARVPADQTRPAGRQGSAAGGPGTT